VALLVLGAAGALGGSVNGLLAQEGFVAPRLDHLPDGGRVIRPGFLGNALTGVVTAIVLAGLYTPVGQLDLAALDATYRLTVSGFAGAILSGVGGARLLTNEVNRRFDKATTSAMADTVKLLAADQTKGSV
jgi:hypothetical protein